MNEFDCRSGGANEDAVCCEDRAVSICVEAAVKEGPLAAERDVEAGAGVGLVDCERRFEVSWAG